MIDNQHSGDVVAKGLVTIGPNAIVHGAIQARVIHIFGKLQGDVSVSDYIAIESSANVSRGVLTSKTISIHSGAVLNDVTLTTI